MRMPKNLGWKLGSLLLAVLLWLAFSATPDVITSHSAPILYQNLASGLMVTGDSPDSVHIELRGPTGQLTAAALADTVALFDLSGVTEAGERTFTISETNLNLPPGVTFLRAVPSQLRLRFSRLLGKDVPVQIRFTGKLPEGYEIVSKTVSPDRLRIAGSETRVSAVNAVETDAIDLSTITQSGEYRIDAFVPDPQVRFESSPVVTVTLTVERAEKPKQ